MEEQEKPQCHFCMGLLIGGAIGALAGIFFAPKSGKELRSDIKEKGSEVLTDIPHIKIIRVNPLFPILNQQNTC
jgi:hypothetical protein